jgi:hypothetical protein
MMQKVAVGRQSSLGLQEPCVVAALGEQARAEVDHEAGGTVIVGVGAHAPPVVVELPMERLGHAIWTHVSSVAGGPHAVDASQSESE